MHQPLIIQHLFQVSTLEDVSRERLEAFVETYPSYGIGHYLLSCKLQAEGSERFIPETQRTCLYFSNPLWLQWQLQNSDGPMAMQPASLPAVSVVESVAWEPVTAYNPETSPAAAEETLADPSVAPVENVVTMAEEAFSAPAGDDLAEALTAGETGTVVTESDAITAAEIDNITAGEGEQVVASETTPDVSVPSAAEQLLRSIEEARELRESLQNLNEDFTAEPPVPAEEPIRDEETPFVLEETEEKPVITETPVAAEASVIAETPVAAEAPAGPEAAKAAATPATQDFLFEPYHTIDYFASQGIRFTLDENPADKLGKQLKSFTDWLKTMRRLPQKDREVVPDRVMEQAIQTSAAHSIQGKDVLTETMAEVLAKQGMREKARAVYEKLSLLNPEKRAYFAAKIEQLNIP